MYLNSALRGRYETELTLRGTRDISNPDFQRLMPFIVDCSNPDQVIPAGTPSPQMQLNAPAIFYSRADDTVANLPRIRIQSSSVDEFVGFPPPGFSNGGAFCIQHKYNAALKGLAPYNEVITIENHHAANYQLDLNALLPTCTSFSATRQLSCKYGSKVYCDFFHLWWISYAW